MSTIFNSAKLKLTGLYLLIIMFVTVSFSFFIFSGVNEVTKHALEGQRRRIEIRFNEVPVEFRRQIPFEPFNAETLLEIRERVLYNLILINIIIFLVSGSLGYYLAGKTLKPIEEVIAKQKRFISDAAHELKTPLTAIKADLEVTLRNKNMTLGESKEALTRTVVEIDELSLLTANLLASSKYNNSDIYKKNIKTFNLEELIRKVIKKLKPKSNEKNINIEEDLESIEIKADIHEIEQVFANIIDNAIKYSKNDSGIEVSSVKSGNTATVKIKDHGAGIPERNLNLIFEPFFRGDKSRSRSKTEGYGLGLAITRDIVESYGGTISAESKPGKGSTFTIGLPCDRKDVLP